MKKIIIKNFTQYLTEEKLRELIRDNEYQVVVVKSGIDFEIWGLEDEMDFVKCLLDNMKIKYSNID